MERHQLIVPLILIPNEQSVASSGGGGGGGEHVRFGGSSGGDGGTVGGVDHSVADMKAFGPRHFGLHRFQPKWLRVVMVTPIIHHSNVHTFESDDDEFSFSSL